MYMVAVVLVWAEWIINFRKIRSQLTNVDGVLIKIKTPSWIHGGVFF
jgi:hypothetical protein